MKRTLHEKLWLAVASILFTIGWGGFVRGIALLTGNSRGVYLIGWGFLSIVGGLVLLFLLASEARD